MQKFLQLCIICALTCASIAGYTQKQKSLPHHMTDEEQAKADQIGKDFSETNPPVGEIRPIAEFEPMESVLIRYPFGIPMDFIATLSEEINVITIVSGQTQENTVFSQYEDNGVNTANVSFVHSSTDSYWTRDYGPWFIEHGNHEISIIDFPYNRPRPGDDDIPIVLADSLNMDLFGMDLIHTGGNYMADGRSVAASTDLVIEENDYTVDEINSLVNEYMGISTYHLNEDPLGEYIEHIDCWSKFLAVDKILIGQVPESDPRYEDYEAVAEYYENATSAWGTPYEVHRIYTPGGSPATPYTNSLILNDRVFVPLTGSEWDDEAIDTYEEVMPGYEIIGVMQGSYEWQNTDALHCRTHEIPDQNMLKIKHTPMLGDTGLIDEYTVQAKIIPFSGQSLYTDSLKVFYKTDDNANYTSTLMQSTGENSYEATIPLPGNYNEVSYYIHAADHSGRSENHPYIGGADPHYFREVVPPELTTKDATIYIDESGVATLTGNEVIEHASSSTALADTLLSQAAFNCSETGINNIEASVEDVNGVKTSKTAIITVEDTTSPLISTHTLMVELNESGEASITADEVTELATDNCSISNLTMSQNTFNNSDLGTQTISVTAEDNHGNSSSSNVEITVVESESPTLTTKDATIELDEDGMASLSPKQLIESASDNAELADSSLSQQSFTCNETGEHTINVTITDKTGLSTTQTAEVTVVDQLPPYLSVTSHTIYIGKNGSASLPPRQVIKSAYDNCSITDTILSQSAFSAQDLGVLMLDITLSDPSGNTITDQTELTLHDTTAPDLSTRDITIQLDNNGTASISGKDVISYATDNGILADTIISQTSFSTDDPEVVSIDVTVKDSENNSVTNTSKVTIADATSIGNVPTGELHIYPNPTNGVLNLENKQEIITKVHIIDLSGKTVLKTTEAGNKKTMHINDLKPGIYQLRVFTRRNTFTSKIIVR